MRWPFFTVGQAQALIIGQGKLHKNMEDSCDYYIITT